MTYYFTLAVVLLVYVHLWFVVSILKKRNDVADIAWGLGYVLLAWASLIFLGTATFRAIVTTMLVSLWGMRLATHIYRRNKGKPEDHRYAAWRKEWGTWVYIRSYLQVFLLQGLLLYVIALPVVVINRSAHYSFSFLDVLGVIVWIIGFYFESVADAQLAAFVRDPKNKGSLMQQGLWRYSRHPNYFGEVVQWWGIYIMALSVPGGWVTIVGPLAITVLIVFVSGIPLLEKKYADRADFQKYARTTSVFFPLPPKST